MKYVDRNLNIKKPALEILTLLGKRQVVIPAGSYCETNAWYNGRERGVSLLLRDYAKREALVVVWTEARNSDSLVVYTWKVFGGFMNPPRFSDNEFTHEVYKAGRYFGPDDQKKVASYIHGLVKEYAA